MPSQKRRIALTVDNELDALLEDIKGLTGTPKSTFIIEFLNDAKPLLVELRDALKLAQEKKNYMPSLVKMTALVNAKNAEINEGVIDLASQQIDWVENEND